MNIMMVKLPKQANELLHRTHHQHVLLRLTEKINITKKISDDRLKTITKKNNRIKLEIISKYHTMSKVDVTFAARHN